MLSKMLNTELRAAQRQAPHIPADDLAQSAAIGLHDATKRHDAKLGPLALYARYRVRGELRDEIRRWSPLSKRHHAAVGDEGLADCEHRIGAELATTTPGHAEQCHDRIDVQRAIQALPARLQYVLRRVYWGDATLGQVGQELGVCESAVCKMRLRAEQQIKRRLSPRGACM